MPSTKNNTQVKQITETINQAQAIFLVDYQGITANQFNDLRTTVRKAGGNLQVTKNTLFTVALRQSQQNVNLNKSDLSHSTAALFCNNDVVNPLKSLVKYSKDNNLPTLKLGIYQKQILNVDRIDQLSNLPDQQVLIGQVVGLLNSPLQRMVSSLNAPIQKLAIALNEIAKQKAQ